MADLGIVCGMAAEARALGRWRRDARIAVEVSGGRPDRAEVAARRLLDGGAGALLSWGIAGGLDPALARGALVVPARVTGSGDWPVNPGGRAAGVLAGAEAIVADPGAKAALRRATGAVAVDMESHRVAAVALAAGIPCFVIRAISDPADRALPAMAAQALGPDGRPRIGAVLRGVVRRPADLLLLIAAARDSRRALRALADLAGRLDLARLAAEATLPRWP